MISSFASGPEEAAQCYDSYNGLECWDSQQQTVDCIEVGSDGYGDDVEWK